MSIAIQLIHPSVIETELFDQDHEESHEKLHEKSFDNVSVFELIPEQHARHNHSETVELQAEVRALREELLRAEHSIAQYETLLRNSLVREQELRAQIFKKD